MKLLKVGNKSRNKHLIDLSEELIKLKIDVKVIIDTDFIDKTLNLNFRDKLKKKNRRKELIKIFNPDLVLLDRISTIGEFFIERNIPLFVLLRGNFWEEVKLVKEKENKTKLETVSIYRNEKLADHIFSASTGIITISEYLKEEVKKRYPTKDVNVIYADGRKISEWIKKEEKNFHHPCVGLVQGFDIWGKTKELETLECVMKNLPHVTFYLAGDGTYRDKVIPRLEKFENFIWLQNLDYPEKIIQFLSSIDIFLLLSGLEGLGQSIIEAMIMKKPVIASNVGGIPEIVKDGETGFLVNKGDSEKITFLINELISNSNLKEKIISNAEKNVHNFSWSSIAIELIKIFEKHRLNNDS